MKPTLFILAAGMGSRYGSLKQIDEVGPNGETIMDYSIYDAILSGFGKIVFVIRHSFEKEFKEKILPKYKDKVLIEIVFQELEYLPDGFIPNIERKKPWGINHALLMGKDVIREPFGIINADDFYGRDSFQLLADELIKMYNKQHNYCLIGYPVEDTLSESGPVARAICELDKHDYLTLIVNRSVNAENHVPGYIDENGKRVNISSVAPVSMNMWGFTPDYFDLSETEFSDFLSINLQSLTAEFLIPTVVNSLIQIQLIKVKLIHTPAKWFGVTYASDKPYVVNKIQELIEQNVYPKHLFI